MGEQSPGVARKVESPMAGRDDCQARQEEEKNKHNRKGQRGPQKKKDERDDAVINQGRTAEKALVGAMKNHSSVTSVSSVVKKLNGAVNRSMPAAIHPMLATSIEKPFDDPEWLFEIKWDGYRAVSFLKDGKARLVSRNQNDLTARYPELHDLPKFIKGENAILDGEIVALDEEGRSSFSLMQQRTGIRQGGRRTAARGDIPVLYYVFDLLYLDGYDLRRIPLEQRKDLLSQIITAGGPVRFSDHFARGVALFEAAKQKGLEGILAKRRTSFYEERRSHEWLKIKITHTLECVIGGGNQPGGGRAKFGAGRVGRV